MTNGQNLDYLIIKGSKATKINGKNMFSKSQVKPKECSFYGLDMEDDSELCDFYGINLWGDWFILKIYGRYS